MLVSFEVKTRKQLLHDFARGEVGILVAHKHLKSFVHQLHRAGIPFDIKPEECPVYYFTFTGHVHQVKDYAILRDYTDNATGMRVYNYTHGGLSMWYVINP